MYHVLQDFMVFAKGSSYVVAGLVMLLFVIFYYYLVGGETKRR